MDYLERLKKAEITLKNMHKSIDESDTDKKDAVDLAISLVEDRISDVSYHRLF